ncbi:MAG: peptidase C45 [Sphingobacteriaceae bacterium]|nr:peptidase C45 [Cytophagaceae bacterium]
MKKTRRWKWILYPLVFLAGLLGLLTVYLTVVALEHPPEVADKSSLSLQRQQPSPGFFTLKNNWFRHSKSGFYELYVEGDPFERGVVNGKLTKELLKRQEDHFTGQINKLVPSEFYRSFLKYFIGWFNRHLAENVTDEAKQEIYGVSQSAPPEYEYIGSGYQRMLNYHAAHDIGHALQNLALVGCTSFGTWNGRSADSTLIVGRNFDFYVGDKFAEEKIIAFYNPTRGYKLMTVTWAGFTGAVSGMNEKGLSVTLNAAPSEVPSGSATPVSLVAREVLQYAGNIAEAVEIVKKRKMFVAESFLVASAADNKAVIIEKTPEAVDVYDPNQNFIACTNHFQSKSLRGMKSNQDQLANSASPYRYQRLLELMQASGKNTVQKTVDLLRDQRGLHGANIGLGNEKALNQLMAHHAVVFQPQKRLVWISTSPYQLGQFIAYDLTKVFARRGMKKDEEVNEPALTIAADPFLSSPDYLRYVKFRAFKHQIEAGEPVNADSLVASNPEYYDTYRLAGDVLFKEKKPELALAQYRRGLTKVIATKKEEAALREKVKKCEEILRE